MHESDQLPNAAFERNNVQSNSLKDFITLNDLCVSWDAPNTAAVPTNVNISLNHSSRIGHFIVDRCIFHNIVCHEVTFDPMYLSSHGLLVLYALESMLLRMSSLVMT